MIVKELEHPKATDKFEQAGYRAEEQLAFYLKREFKDDPEILIFNHLRLEKAGDTCQIDHLVLHQYGIIIIESKSVTTRVEVNELGEWKRWFNKSWQGMPSPILQAQRQGKFLKVYLEDHVEQLLNKLIFGTQAHFSKMPIDVLVAISDSGIINRPKNDKLDNVRKAEQITDKIKETISEYRQKDTLLSLSIPPYKFDKNEIPRISKFLICHHKPILTEEKTNFVSQSKIQDLKSQNKPIIKTAKSSSSPNICISCQSQNLSILYGYSYYFKCLDCNKKTAIKNTCLQCGTIEKIRKSGLQFFMECSKCGTSRLFHTNASTDK